jgi:hypothetical protein
MDAEADPKAYELMCAGKEKYPSESAVNAAIKVYRKQKQTQKGSLLHSYECRFCEQWHFGH